MQAVTMQRTAAQPSEPWVATLTDPSSSACANARTLIVPIGAAHLVSSNPRTECTALFDGVIYNRGDLREQLDTPEAGGQASDVQLVRLAYERWGEDMLAHIKGIFALVVWDGAKNIVLAARDPLGAYPLFYAEVGARTYFATDPSAIVRTPGVPGDFNRLALADHLAHRWPDPEETYFEALRRVPPGHAVSFAAGTRRTCRYWDPTPPGEPVKWATEAEVERFGDTLEQAVNRCMSFGRTGVFLSGGFDSVSVAAIAADALRRQGRPSPLALSLAFPDPECAEEEVQRAVAERLAMPQMMLPFAVAVGERGLLAASIEMAGSWPVPMLNIWNPAYHALAREGAKRGCHVVLTGNGGDEWLSVTPYIIADLLKAGDFSSLFDYLAMMKRSYKASRWALWRNGLWNCGVRPLASAALGRIAPNAWRANRIRRLVQSTPDWIAPDASLRARMDARAGKTLADPNPAQGFYLRDGRSALDHPLVALELEEAFEMGRRAGLGIRHPYWDADLVHLLHRVPPQLLNRGGRSKGLVRHEIARRFPNLGFERQKKVTATTFFQNAIREEGPAAWHAMGRPRALHDLGVADAAKLDALAREFLGGSADRPQLYRIWDVLALEAWVRQHQN